LPSGSRLVHFAHGFGIFFGLSVVVFDRQETMILWPVIHLLRILSAQPIELTLGFIVVLVQGELLLFFIVVFSDRFEVLKMAILCLMEFLKILPNILTVFDRQKVMYLEIHLLRLLSARQLEGTLAFVVILDPCKMKFFWRFLKLLQQPNLLCLQRIFFLLDLRDMMIFRILDILIGLN